VRHSINPNPYTGVFGNDGARYAEDVAEVVATCTPGRVAGFIAEAIQGVGGSVPLADGYLPAVYKARPPARPPDALPPPARSAAPAAGARGRSVRS